MPTLNRIIGMSALRYARRSSTCVYPELRKPLLDNRGVWTAWKPVSVWRVRQSKEAIFFVRRGCEGDIASLFHGYGPLFSPTLTAVIRSRTET